MDRKKIFLKGLVTLLPVLGIAGAILVFATRPKPARRPMSAMIPVVETTPISPVSTAIKVEGLGIVIADRTASLQAEVSGRIVSVMPGLVEGALVRKGDVLLTLDARDYELAVKTAEARLLEARSGLRLEEGQQAVAKHERELVGADVELDEAYEDLMLRGPQLQAAQAALESAQAALDSAKLDLARTRIRAPFDAGVLVLNSDEGDYASPGQPLVELAAIDRFFVRVALPVRSLDLFPGIGGKEYAAEITLTDGAVCRGRLHKLLPDLSEQGRMARVLVTVDDPLNAAPRPMLLGEAVRVTLSGRTAEQVYLLDRKSLHDRDRVWMIDQESRLHVLDAEVVQGYEDTVLVRLDFEPGWKLITSEIAAPVEAMTLKVYSQAGDTE